jgi:hypothetical protein
MRIVIRCFEQDTMLVSICTLDLYGYKHKIWIETANSNDTLCWCHLSAASGAISSSHKGEGFHIVASALDIITHIVNL